MAFPSTLNNLSLTHSPGQVILSADENAQSVDANAMGVKIGSGASTPTFGKVLTGTGIGSSAWNDPSPEWQSGVGFKSMFGTAQRGDIPTAAQLTTNAIAGLYNWPAAIAALPEVTVTLATQLSGITAGTQKRLLPGVYREALPSLTVANLRIYGYGDVAITGMDRWSVGSSNTWTTAAAPNNANGSFVSSLTVPTFTVDGDSPPINSALLAAAEQVMVDGVMFNKVAAGSTLSVGQWMLDGSRHVVLRTADSAVTGHKIEVTTRQNWCQPGAGATNLTLDGIYFYGAASGADTAAPLQQNSQANFTIRNCMIGFTHGIAIAGGGAAGLKVLDNVFHNCGTIGIVSSSSGTLVSGNIAYNCGGTQNNYAGSLDQSGYDYAWGNGFCKLVGDYTTIRDNICFNMGFCSYWQDVLCRYGTIVNNVAWDNREQNIMVEVSSYFKVYGNHIFQTAATQFSTSSLGVYISSSRDGDCGPDLDAGEDPNVVMRIGTAYKLGWQTSRTDLPPSGTNDAGSGGFRRVRCHDNIAILRKTGGQGGGGPDVAIHWSDITTGAPGAAINDASNTGWHTLIGFGNGVDNVTGMTWADDFIFLSDVTGLAGQHASGWFYNVTEWNAIRWDTGTDVDARTHKSRMLTFAEQQRYLNMYGLPAIA